MFASVIITLVMVVVLAALLFGSAGRWDLPMVWAYLVVFFLSSVLGSVMIHRRNPGLVERRLRIGRSDIPDRLYRASLGVGFIGHYIIAGLDIGRHWSSVPLIVQIIGLIGFAAGLWLSLWAASVNPFFTGEVRIQEEHGQHVITAGPYQYVRHPGYSGGILFMLCSGLALGSWWSILPMLWVVATLIRRTALEDRMLQQQLQGYTDYTQKVRFRLAPGLW